ncbi:MAG TPA: hypothetical protein VFD27_05495 [Chthoniobacteraceae bacterium]|nr:hypothetical protein [Chthoniobacteraceae bacterium]
MRQRTKGGVLACGDGAQTRRERFRYPQGSTRAIDGEGKRRASIRGVALLKGVERRSDHFQKLLVFRAGMRDGPRADLEPGFPRSIAGRLECESELFTRLRGEIKATVPKHPRPEEIGARGDGFVLHHIPRG